MTVRVANRSNRHKRTCAFTLHFTQNRTQILIKTLNEKRDTCVCKTSTSKDSIISFY